MVQEGIERKKQMVWNGLNKVVSNAFFSNLDIHEKQYFPTCH